MSINTVRCQAMIDAKIEDASSPEGIDFCVTSCPYEKGCVLFESATGPTRYDIRVNFAKKLYAHGVSIVDICLIVRRSEKTVYRYLGKK